MSKTEKFDTTPAGAIPRINWEHPDVIKEVLNIIHNEDKRYVLLLEKSMNDKEFFERKIIDYIVICSMSITDIQERVMTHITQGYSLQAGICVQGDMPDPHVQFNKFPIYYYQAMVKYE